MARYVHAGRVDRRMAATQALAVPEEKASPRVDWCTRLGVHGPARRLVRISGSRGELKWRCSESTLERCHGLPNTCSVRLSKAVSENQRRPSANRRRSIFSTVLGVAADC